MLTQKEMKNFIEKELGKDVFVGSYKKMVIVEIKDLDGFDKHWNYILRPVDEEKIEQVQKILENECENYRDEPIMYGFNGYDVIFYRESLDIPCM